MELIERTGFLASLQKEYVKSVKDEGHCILLAGEAGIGKTSLIRAFCREKKNDCEIYHGSCDALFTPRPLAPVYDIAWQICSDLCRNNEAIDDRTHLFSSLFNELRSQQKPSIIIFEDIHWADEATLDFIKFFARRITQLRCLFILTYRDDEVCMQHPLRNVLGQLPPDSFTGFQLPPLSRQAVEKMAREKGYNGEDVYSISGGNPFYVNEILASYSPGIPENIKDAVLAVFNKGDDHTRHVWEILSVLPTGFEIKYLEKMEPAYFIAIENCITAKILISDKGLIFFKHELYRRTIEVSLSPLLRVALNKRILNLFLESFEQNHETERIIHHAKNANEYELVVKYAPLAAKQSAVLGAHVEAAKLYASAIEYYKGADKNILLELYKAYAWECYLSNQVNEAIIYQELALTIYKDNNNDENTGNCLRFLSWLWWLAGNREKAESYAQQAIDVLSDSSPSKAQAMAFSNMSQLKMLSYEHKEAVYWAEKAMAIADGLKDEEALSYALNSMGIMYMMNPSLKQKRIHLLQQSLKFALRNGYHEHVARAYANLACSSIALKEDAFANETLQAGIQYCEEKHLDLWTAYLLSIKAKLYLQSGCYNEALGIAKSLIGNKNQSSVVKITALTVLATIDMRRGDDDAAPLLLEANAMALSAAELQQMLPILTALLEYEWITGKRLIEKPMLDFAISTLEQPGHSYIRQFDFWLLNVRQHNVANDSFYDEYTAYLSKIGPAKANCLADVERPYEQALYLFEGDSADKKRSISLVRGLGANAVYEKMKHEMRSSGIKSIPRGMRRTTQSNPAFLTNREMEILCQLKEGMQNKEIAEKLFISAKTVDHHISAILTKLDTNSRAKAVNEAIRLKIII